MKSLLGPFDFALQSSVTSPFAILDVIERSGEIALLLAASRYPQAGSLSLAGLAPRRHHLLKGASQRFCRADDAGHVSIALRLDGPGLLTISRLV